MGNIYCMLQIWNKNLEHEHILGLSCFITHSLFASYIYLLCIQFRIYKTKLTGMMLLRAMF
jgi:hypothetical protein